MRYAAILFGGVLANVWGDNAGKPKNSIGATFMSYDDVAANPLDPDANEDWQFGVDVPEPVEGEGLTIEQVLEQLGASNSRDDVAPVHATAAEWTKFLSAEDRQAPYTGVHPRVVRERIAKLLQDPWMELYGIPYDREGSGGRSPFKPVHGPNGEPNLPQLAMFDRLQRHLRFYRYLLDAMRENSAAERLEEAKVTLDREAAVASARRANLHMGMAAQYGLVNRMEWPEHYLLDGVEPVAKADEDGDEPLTKAEARALLDALPKRTQKAIAYRVNAAGLGRSRKAAVNLLRTNVPRKRGLHLLAEIWAERQTLAPGGEVYADSEAGASNGVAEDNENEAAWELDQEDRRTDVGTSPADGVTLFNREKRALNEDISEARSLLSLLYGPEDALVRIEGNEDRRMLTQQEVEAIELLDAEADERLGSYPHSILERAPLKRGIKVKVEAGPGFFEGPLDMALASGPVAPAAPIEYDATAFDSPRRQNTSYEAALAAEDEGRMGLMDSYFRNLDTKGFKYRGTKEYFDLENIERLETARYLPTHRDALYERTVDTTCEHGKYHPLTCHRHHVRDCRGCRRYDKLSGCIWCPETPWVHGCEECDHTTTRTFSTQTGLWGSSLLDPREDAEEFVQATDEALERASRALNRAGIPYRRLMDKSILTRTEQRSVRATVARANVSQLHRGDEPQVVASSLWKAYREAPSHEEFMDAARGVIGAEMLDTTTNAAGLTLAIVGQPDGIRFAAGWRADGSRVFGAAPAGKDAKFVQLKETFGGTFVSAITRIAQDWLVTNGHTTGALRIAYLQAVQQQARIQREAAKAAAKDAAPGANAEAEEKEVYSFPYEAPRVREAVEIRTVKDPLPPTPTVAVEPHFREGRGNVFAGRYTDRDGFPLVTDREATTIHEYDAIVISGNLQAEHPARPHNRGEYSENLMRQLRMMHYTTYQQYEDLLYEGPVVRDEHGLIRRTGLAQRGRAYRLDFPENGKKPRHCFVIPLITDPYLDGNERYGRPFVGSKLEWLETGLLSLAFQIREMNGRAPLRRFNPADKWSFGNVQAPVDLGYPPKEGIRTIAIPAIGTGRGRLNPVAVRDMVEAFSRLVPGVNVVFLKGRQGLAYARETARFQAINKAKMNLGVRYGPDQTLDTYDDRFNTWKRAVVYISDSEDRILERRLLVETNEGYPRTIIHRYDTLKPKATRFNGSEAPFADTLGTVLETERLPYWEFVHPQGAEAYRGRPWFGTHRKLSQNKEYRKRHPRQDPRHLTDGKGVLHPLAFRKWAKQGYTEIPIEEFRRREGRAHPLHPSYGVEPGQLGFYDTVMGGKGPSAILRKDHFAQVNKSLSAPGARVNPDLDLHTPVRLKCTESKFERQHTAWDGRPTSFMKNVGHPGCPGYFYITPWEGTAFHTCSKMEDARGRYVRRLIEGTRDFFVIRRPTPQR